MRNRLVDILGVDLAEAMQEEGGQGCARELRFDTENGVCVGLDFEDYEEEGVVGIGVERELSSSDEEGEGVFEYVDEVESEGDAQGLDDDEFGEAEEGVGDVGASGSGFTTPKRTGMVETVFGEEEEEIPPPAVGMVFGSWEEVDTYFWRYGRQRGFGIVRAAAGWGKVKKELGEGRCCKQKKNAKWTCECYGKPSRKRKVDMLKEGLAHDEETAVKRKSKKCGCPVEIYASVNEDGNWVIRKQNLEHDGHIVTPRKAKDVSMFRKHELLEKNNHLVKQVQNANKSRVKTSQMYSSFARERNGVEEMGFTQKDLENAVAEKKKLQLTEGDANGMIEYFNKMSSDNQNFFHLCRFGKDGALQDVVWVDARSRAAYEEFCDVVCFDSTYLTNKFHLPFAVFLGVNHHGQSILFGCALISRETTETYAWVFRTWLHCMGGKAPLAILTDQDPAIRKALRATMPDTCHRWCIWHILHKFGKYLGKVEDYDAVKEELENIIYGSLEVDEFVDRWEEAILYYELEDNEWLEGLYEERHMWIPAYLKNFFWAGMKTTQRSESFNHFFKGYVDSHTTLSEFVVRYCDAMSIRAEAERIADSNTLRYVRPVITDFPAELLFQKCYTDAKFKEVQWECTKILYLRCLDQIEIGTTMVEFVIEDRIWIKPKYARKEAVTKARRCYRVCFDRITYEAVCDCKHFECRGIICRHMILVYDLSGVTIVPEKYVLRRWRKDVQRKHTRVKVAYHDPLKTDEVRQYHKLMGTYEPICSKASTCKEGVEAVAELLQLMDVRVDEVLAMVAKKREEAAKAARESANAGETETAAGTERTPSSVGQNSRGDASHRPGVQGSVLPNTSTPGSAYVGSCEGSAPSVIKDPPLPKKKSHRTTTVRYPSCTEKKGKEKAAVREKNAARAKAKKAAAVAAAQTPVSLSRNEYIRSAGGIQMRDVDGSLGYFTSRSGNSGGVFASLLGVSPPYTSMATPSSHPLL